MGTIVGLFCHLPERRTGSGHDPGAGWTAAGGATGVLIPLTPQIRPRPGDGLQRDDYCRDGQRRFLFSGVGMS